MPLRIDERLNGEVVILDMHGKITADDDSLRQTIQSIAARGTRFVVLNFTDVSYMDSVGLSLLVRAHLSLRQHDGTLALLRVPPHIETLLTTTQLITLLHTFNDESVAVRTITTQTTVPSSP
jgi:anti-sigma B factor antagonist